MTNSVIEVKNLTKIYKLYDKPINRMKEALSISRKKYHKEYFALNDINFTVNKGETVGIIGTNGAGKSTLLKILTGVLTPTSGEVSVKGKISALLELGAGFNPEYTGLENIFLNGTMMGYTNEEMEKKVPAILEFADIGDFIHQQVKTYSSGMFARLAFSVAINVEPDILIVDEALSVGDVFFQNKCFRKFDELQKIGTTILFVSHDMHSIKQMCSKVIWIDKGNQKMFSSKEDVCTAYLNERMKSMNIGNLETVNELLDIKNEINIIKSKDIIEKWPSIKYEKNSILSDDAKILSFYIKNNEGKIVNSIDIEKTYTFHIVVEFFSDIKNVICGIVFENNKGIDIFSLNTFINGNESTFNASKNDILEVVFRIKIPRLKQDKYLISPAVAQGVQDNHVVLTWLHNVQQIQLYNDSYNLSLLELGSDLNIYKYNTNE